MKNPTGEMPGYYYVHDEHEFDALKERFYEATGSRSFADLAEFLAVSPAQISDARRRLRIPFMWFQLVFLKTNIDPAWLKDGAGERSL